MIANRLFAEKLKGIIRFDDLVRVHDYQLFLLPGFLRDEFPFANIGYFYTSLSLLNYSHLGTAAHFRSG